MGQDGTRAECKLQRRKDRCNFWIEYVTQATVWDLYTIDGIVLNDGNNAVESFAWLIWWRFLLPTCPDFSLYKIIPSWAKSRTKQIINEAFFFALLFMQSENKSYRKHELENQIQ